MKVREQHYGRPVFPSCQATIATRPVGNRRCREGDRTLDSTPTKEPAAMSDSTSRKQSKDAARSVVVTLRNNTPFDLQLNRNTESLPHGKWDEYPPTFIRSGDKGAWKTESDELMSGTEGRVSYNILDQSHNSVSVNWDDPFQGSDA